MFTITVQLHTGSKKAIAPGPRRALAIFEELRDAHGVEPTVADQGRRYSEQELRALAEKTASTKLR